MKKKMIGRQSTTHLMWVALGVETSCRPWHSTPGTPHLEKRWEKPHLWGPWLYAQIGDLWVALFLFKDSWGIQSYPKALKFTLCWCSSTFPRGLWSTFSARDTWAMSRRPILRSSNYPTGIGPWQILTNLPKQKTSIDVYGDPLFIHVCFHQSINQSINQSIYLSI